MEKDLYEGFVPDKKAEYLIPGVGILFFLTSCVLAITLFPTLFSTQEFADARTYEGLPPTQDQVRAIIGIALVHLIWALVPFLIANFIFHKRKDAIVYAITLVGLGIWIFATLPLSYAGNILLITLWSIGTIILFIYRRVLD